jgi:hypothetical protein
MNYLSIQGRHMQKTKGEYNAYGGYHLQETLAVLSAFFYLAESTCPLAI